MYMLRKRILTDSDLDDNTTWKRDLPDTGSITAFELRIQCNRHADRDDLDVCYPLCDMVSLVEIISEGTTKVQSISGRQCDFFNYLDFKRPTPRRHREVAGGGNDLTLYLMGGRGLYDTEYGFDMAKLKNAFLNYTYNLHEGVAEYFAANDHDVQVYAWHWMGPGAPTFKGYFRRRQVLTYTTTGGSVIKTLPITPGPPLRRVVVQKKDFDETLGGTWSAIELEVNNGEYSPIVITSPMDYAMQQVPTYQLRNRSGGLIYLDTANSAAYLPADFAYLQSGSVTHHAVAEAGDYGSLLGITLPLRAYANAVGEYVYEVEGYGYQGCLNLGFDHLPDMGDLLITRGMGALKLHLTETEATNTGAVSLEDVIFY